MRVLIAAHGFPPTRTAGAERRAERMADWLAARGHHVEVFAIERTDRSGLQVERRPRESPGGYAVHRASFDLGHGAEPFRNTYDFEPVAEAIREVLRAGRFDLVHLVCGHLIAVQTVGAARAAGLPVVFTLTEFWPLCARLNLIDARGALCSGPEPVDKCVRCLAEDRRRFRIPARVAPALVDAYWRAVRRSGAAARARAEVVRRQAMLRAAVEAADLVICPSRFLMRTFEQCGCDTRRFVFMRQGLQSRPAAGEQAPPPRPGRLRLAYVGQIKPHKGVDLVIGAVDALVRSGRDVSLDVWGSETEAPAYVARLRRRSASVPAVRWRGQYVGNAVGRALSGVDAVVVPSRWYENSPNAILEAYAFGLPVVATDLGGMAELVEHGTSGLLFRLNDAGDLAQRLGRLVDDPALLPRLRAGIPPVKTLDEEMRELASAYGRLIEASRRRRRPSEEDRESA